MPQYKVQSVQRSLGFQLAENIADKFTGGILFLQQSDECVGAFCEFICAESVPGRCDLNVNLVL